jgi:hypothetical protein
MAAEQDIAQISVGALGTGRVQNAAIAVGTSVFNAPLPAGRWKYVEVDVGTADTTVAIAIDENPSIGSGSDGSMSWGVGCARRGGTVALIPTLDMSDDNELRLISDTASTDVIVNLFRK